MDIYGYGELDLISTHSVLFTSSLDKTGGRSSHCITDESKTPQPVFTHNDFYLNKDYSPPDTKMTLPPTAYTSPSIPSLLTLFDLKHHWHHPPYVYNFCPDGWNLMTILSTTTTPPQTLLLLMTLSQFDGNLMMALSLPSKQKQSWTMSQMPKNPLPFDDNADRDFNDDDSETEFSQDKYSPIDSSHSKCF